MAVIRSHKTNKMSKKVNEKIAPVLKKMKVGEKQLFQIGKSVTVRNTCSQIKLSKGFDFATSQNRISQVIEVTRIS